MKFRHIDTDEYMQSIMSGDPAMSFMLFNDDFDYYIDKQINWHWHPHLEFAMCTHGSIEYCVDGDMFTINEGEGIFINSYNLHMGRPADDHSVRMIELPSMFTVTFSPDLIASSGKSVLYEKYVLPIISDRSLQKIRLYPDVAWQNDILDCLKKMYDLDEAQQSGYELKIHIQLCIAWDSLVSHLDNLHTEPVRESVIQNQRLLQEMIVYIQRHYSEDISPKTIAASVNISTSSCYRCFQDCLRMPPMKYVQEFRIERSMYLLRTTDMSVSEIGSVCGLGSTSFFIQKFRKKTGLTPLSFRNKVMKEK